MTHVDLFSGIGGFAVAAQQAGFETIAFCESDSRCREFLRKTWGLPVEPDVRKLDGRKYAGISLLTGGPPCQPASRAGKQGGAGDDRWLWPEALRVLDEAKPDCVVFENPPGILDVGIDGILSQMGGCGYEVQPFDIPACAVDSPQLRHRFWFVGFLANPDKRRERNQLRRSTGRELALGNAAESNGNDMADTSRDGERGIREAARANRKRVGQPCESNRGSMADSRRERSGQDEQERRSDQRAIDRRDCENDISSVGLADPTEPRREGADSERAPNGCSAERPASVVADTESLRRVRRTPKPSQTEGRQSRPEVAGLHWQNSIWVPCADGKLRRAPDDSFDLVDGLHRSLLAALGNSICPEVAYQILSAVKVTLEG